MNFCCYILHIIVFAILQVEVACSLIHAASSGERNNQGLFYSFVSAIAKVGVKYNSLVDNSFLLGENSSYLPVFLIFYLIRNPKYP
jgi:hypothetical protein